MSATKKTSSIYDYAVIGAGVSGLCVATNLSRQGANVLLVDASDNYGGYNRSITTSLGPVNNGLRFIPATDLATKAIHFLELTIGTPLKPTALDQPPVTYEEGSVKAFLGFGDNSPAFYDEISYFLAPQQLKLLLEPHEWTPLLFNQFSGEFLPKSYVTKFLDKDGQITGMIINGSKTIQAKNFVFCGNPKDLQVLLSENSLPHKSRQKLSKSTAWTSVCLDLIHSNVVTSSSALHVLNGVTKDDLGPCVGQFHEPTTLNDKSVQFSQWTSFVDTNEAEQSEIIGNCLKKIQRQIKRAYPNALENLVSERIMVAPLTAGHMDLKLTANQSLPQTSNFWVASGLVHPQKNLLGSLLQAEMALSGMGICVPATMVKDSATEEVIENPAGELEAQV